MLHPAYFVVIDRAVSGPHSPAVLQQMASIYVFNADTLITVAGTEAWQPVRNDPELMALLFPQEKKLELTTKVYNAVADASTPISVEGILRDGLDPQDNAVPDLNRARRLSQRTRDYLVSAVLGNGLGLLLYVLLPMNLFIGALLGGFFVMMNFGLYWVYFHIMSRY